MDNRKKKVRKNVNPPNPDQYEFNANYPIGTTAYTQTFDYIANIKIEGSENVTSYEIYINGLYYGNSTIPLSTGYIQINSGDVLTLNIVKTNNSVISIINLVSIIL
jgi:hypothetical protein